MFDVVTTFIYRYTRYEGGPEMEDRTLALKLFSGKHHTRTYPTPNELLDFGRRVCGVSHPVAVLKRIAQGMDEVLRESRKDPRIPGDLLARMGAAWAPGMFVGDGLKR